jgi:integrase/recombinase XerD
MNFDRAIYAFIADWRGYGRINSEHTERSYVSKLELLAADCGKDVEDVTKQDVKATLRRWEHPNSKLQAHSCFIAFFDWATQEDLRDDNPARAVPRARKAQPQINRLTREETAKLLTWAAGGDARPTERWAIYLGVCAGLRCQELCRITKADVSRPGWVHVTRGMGKGNKERWVPVIADLQPIIDEIMAVGPEQGTLIRGRLSTGPKLNEDWKLREKPMSRVGMYRLVQRSGKRAGLYQPITPHTLRHCFGDFIAKYAGLRVAQALLGHASVDTTAGTYVDRVSLDEMQVAVTGATFFQLTSTERPVKEPKNEPNAR